MTNSNTAEIIVRVRDEATGALVKVKGQLDDMGRSAQTAEHHGSNLLGTLGKIAVVGTGVAIAGIGAAVVKTGIGFDQMRAQAEIAFTTMLGSGEKAKSFLDELQAFAAATPFEFPDLVRSSQQLLAMGFSAEKVMPTLTAIGDAASALGGSPELIDRITRALGQVQAKGKLQADQMMMLTEAGIPAWQMLADTIGVSVGDAMDLVTKGAVDSNTAINSIVTGMETRFPGMMEKQSHTFLGLFSTIKDTFGQVAGRVMKPFFDMMTQGMQKIVNFISTNEFNVWVERLSSAVEDLAYYFLAVFQNGDLTIEGLEGMNQSVAKVALTVASFAMTIIKDLIGAFRSLVEWGDKILNFLSGLGGGGGNSLDNAANRGKTLARIIEGIILLKFAMWAGDAATQLGKLAGQAVTAAKNIASIAGKTITITQNIVRTGAKLIEAAFNVLSTITQTIVRAGAALIEKLVDMVQIITQKVVRAGDQLITDLKDITQNITQKITVDVPPVAIKGELSAQSFLASFVKGLLSGIGAIMAPVAVAAALALGVSWAAIAAVLAGVLIVALVGFLIYHFRAQIGRFISSAISAIGEGFSAAGAFLLGVGATIVSAIGNGIVSAITHIPEIVGTVAGTVAGLIVLDILLPFMLLGALITKALVPLAGIIAGALKSALAFVIDIMAKILGTMIGFTLGIVEIVASEFLKIPDYVEAFLGMALNFIMGLPDQAASALAGLSGIFIDAFTAAIGFIITVPGTIAGFIMSIPGLIAGLPGAIAGIFQSIPGAASTAASSSVSFFSTVPGAIIGFFSSIPGAVMSVLGLIPVALTALGSAVIGILTGIGNAVIGVVTGIGNAVIGIFTGLGGAIGSVLESSGIPGFFADVFNRGFNAASDAFMAIINKASDVLGVDIPQQFNKLIDFIKGAAGLFLNAGLAVGNAIVNGITSATETLVGIVKGVLNTTIGVVEGAINAIIKAYNAVADLPLNPLPHAAAISIGRLATGGRAWANNPYFVGENGVELFVPDTSGMVVPNSALGGLRGGGSPTYVVNFYGAVYGFEDFRAAVAEAVRSVSLRGGLYGVSGA